jgi:hypothetical protein
MGARLLSSFFGERGEQGRTDRRLEDAIRESVRSGWISPGVFCLRGRIDPRSAPFDGTPAKEKRRTILVHRSHYKVKQVSPAGVEKRRLHNAYYTGDGG